MGAFVHFAYGSNMLTTRLQRRCPSARPIGAALAQSYHFCFCKRSIDGSGKATLIESPESQAYGVLFEIDDEDRENLDAAEGPGYDYLQDFRVLSYPLQRPQRASAYIAALHAVIPGLKPYDWYKALVIAGALEHGLPQAYIRKIRRVGAIRDVRKAAPNRKECSCP